MEQIVDPLYQYVLYKAASRNSGPSDPSKTIFIDVDIAQGVDKLFPDDCGRLDNGRGALCFGDAVLCRQRKSPL